ncbi:MAG: hypothetical protein PHF14_07065, partial [Verrucomicrobiota bacterium]|nr:hypothetical protein [Verrucomicrobiota bacterium]
MQIRRNCFLQLPWLAETVNPKNFPTTRVGAKEEPPRRQEEPPRRQGRQEEPPRRTVKDAKKNRHD